MQKRDVMECQFSSWYRDFKHCTFKSRVIDLPSNVVDYLLADGLILPEGCDDNLKRIGLEGDSDDEIEWDDNTDEAKGPSFPALNNQIESAMEALGGKIFPKLNWSSPKDATWITMHHNLKCTSLRDIYLLLKSSDFISHDLSQPFDKCVDSTEEVDVHYQLVLRKWRDVNPAGEFRCFVNNNKLIGICQRKLSARFPNIAKQEDDICTDILTFFLDSIQGKFTLINYVFDVYRTEEKIYLVDFNPYGPVTDSLLFSWDQLLLHQPLDFDVHSDIEIKPAFCYIEAENQVESTTYRCYAMPQDFVHLTTGEDPSKLIDFLRMKRRNENDSCSDDD